MIGRLREFLHNMTELVFIGRTYQKILAKCWERTTDCARKKLLCPAEFENTPNNVKMRLPDGCIINRRVLFHRASKRVKINSPRSRGKSHFEFQESELFASLYVHLKIHQNQNGTKSKDGRDSNSIAAVMWRFSTQSSPVQRNQTNSHTLIQTSNELADPRNQQDSIP
jgi:hypothetical protein